MGKIEREKRIVDWMIRFYCRKKHHSTTMLCKDCEELKRYSFDRLTKCPFRDHKTACKDCKVHCYQLDKRIEIRKVMKYSGTRIMLSYHLDFLKYLIK